MVNSQGIYPLSVRVIRCCNVVAQSTHAVTAWMVRLYVPTRGNKIDPKNSNTTTEETSDFRETRESEGGVSDSTLEGELTLTDVHARILEHEGQVSELDVDGLLGLSKDSFGETSATQRLEELALLSDDEHEITMIAAQNQITETSPPTASDKDNQRSRSAEDDPHGAKVANLVRQAAVEELPNATPRDTDKPGRTKEDRAKNGTRKSLAFLAKMGKRDPGSLTAKEKYLLKKHRQDVARFERIYGPVSVLLGEYSPVEQQVVAAVDLADTQKGIRSTAPTTSSAVTTKEGGSSTILQIGASARTVDGNKKPPIMGSGAKGMKNPPADSLKGARMGNIKGNGSGGPQTSSSKAPGCSKASGNAGVTPSSTLKGNQKETIKRARSGDDQPSSSTKKLKKSLSQDVYLQAAIIDRNDPDGKISTDQWQLLEARLLDEMAFHSGSSEDVSFKGADWAKGVKVINCGNKNSFEFLRTVVGKLGDLNPALKLEVIRASELPLRSIVTVWIPPPVRPVETILALLKKQNVDLPIDQWKAVASMVCKENNGRDFRFAVDRKSLEILDKVKGVVNFGFGTVRFRYSKHDTTKEAAGGADKPASL
ncbi:uncharacterized protein LOC135964318 [Calliphora vicina]|uniref:uncharacterized protein LOC135964318 n=1 Tax=Calliphora vicina TaxID=7373 RepID=UPI00325A51B6